MKRAIESLLQTRSRSSEREMGKQAEAGGEIERLLLFFWVLLLLTLIFLNFWLPSTRVTLGYRLV